MSKATKGPSVTQDLGALAELYRTVFWMIGQRIQNGPAWQEKIETEILRSAQEVPEPEREHSIAA